MKGEFNDLTYNNTNITFVNKTNNIQTSDELTAALVYQDKMGTNYSRSKKISKAVSAAGIAILLTAASVKAGSVITNAYVLNPPSVVNDSYKVEDNVFTYSFEIKNEKGYEMTYNISINDELKFTETCSEQKTYEGSFKEFAIGERCLFYIEFSNKVDYTKRIRQVRFTTKGVTL